MNGGIMPQPNIEQPDRVFLMQGAIYVASRPTLVTTILGSCVAVCLWDSVRWLGGMNHFVLPADKDGDRSTRYGDVAIDRLIEGLVGLGCRIGDLRAKIFGGATVLPVSTTAETIGERNCQMALERLRHYGIPIVAQRTGGECGLLIRLNTETGEVTLRTLVSGQESDERAARRGR